MLLNQYKKKFKKGMKNVETFVANTVEDFKVQNLKPGYIIELEDNTQYIYMKNYRTEKIEEQLIDVLIEHNLNEVIDANDIDFDNMKINGKQISAIGYSGDVSNLFRKERIIIDEKIWEREKEEEKLEKKEE